MRFAATVAPITAPPASALGRRREAAVTLVWGALFLNALTFSSLPTVIPIPGPVGQVITQSSLVVAFGLALALNPRVVIRPNIFILLFTLLCLVAVMTSLHNEFIYGSVYRAVRYALFVAVLWLLTPLWGRPENPLLKAHITVLALILGSVVVGLLLSPGAALAYSGRLSGALWPMPPTQVAHYAAVFIGLVSINWLLGLLRGRWAVAALGVSGGMLFATHTRTALLGLGVGLAVAVASLFLGFARVRRVSLIAIAVGLVSAVALAPLLATWLLRGQTTSELGQLTGRTAVWEQVFATPRGFMTTVAGSGMSNASFNGLPIDSNWVATFVDLGLLGITLQVLAILVLLITAVVRPRGQARAAALFLVVYFIAASFTEVGLNAPTTYLLDLTVAASLLARPVEARDTEAAS
jgi:hypothetical protein